MGLHEPWLSLSLLTAVYCRPTVCRPLRIQRRGWRDNFHFMGLSPVWICVIGKYNFCAVVVQSLSRVRLFATPQTAAHQAVSSVFHNFCNQKYNKELLLLKEENPSSTAQASVTHLWHLGILLITHPSHQPAQPFTLQPLVSLKREWQLKINNFFLKKERDNNRPKSELWSYCSPAPQLNLAERLCRA